MRPRATRGDNAGRGCHGAPRDRRGRTRVRREAATIRASARDSRRLPGRSETVAQLAKRGEGTTEGTAARCGHRVQLFPAATALSGRLTEAGGGATPWLEPAARGV